MDYLHVANKKNINSILTHGLLPKHIDLDHHWDTFNYYGLKDRKCVYMWDGETYKNTKYIKDMIYTKLFIHPRNQMFDHTEKDINFNKLGKQLYGDDSKFYLLKISDINDKFGGWDHVQEPGGDNDCTTTIMDDKYAHNDKIIHISGGVISPDKIKIIEEINVRVYHKSHQLGFNFSKIK